MKGQICSSFEMNGSALVFGGFSLLFALFYEEIKDFPFSYVSICFL